MKANEETIYTFQFSKAELDSIDQFMQEILHEYPLKLDSNVILFSRGVNELASDEV